jgi:hypothetical protein
VCGVRLSALRLCALCACLSVLWLLFACVRLCLSFGALAERNRRKQRKRDQRGGEPPQRERGANGMPHSSQVGAGCLRLH